MRRYSQSGNILFLILLAVVLFAALAYAVTSSMRGGGKDASSENARAAAADILQFFSQLDATLLRMQMTDGVKAENMSFVYNRKLYGGTVSPGGNNVNCVANNRRVFVPEGGNVPPRVFENYAFLNPPSYQSNWVAPGHHFLRLIVWPQAGTSLNDMTVVLPAIKQSICDEINAQQSTTYVNLTGTDVGNTGDGSTWDSGVAQSISSANASTFADKTIFMVKSGSSPYCDIYHLIFAR